MTSLIFRVFIECTCYFVGSFHGATQIVDDVLGMFRVNTVNGVGSLQMVINNNDKPVSL